MGLDPLDSWDLRNRARLIVELRNGTERSSITAGQKSIYPTRTERRRICSSEGNETWTNSRSGWYGRREDGLMDSWSCRQCTARYDTIYRTQWAAVVRRNLAESLSETEIIPPSTIHHLTQMQVYHSRAFPQHTPPAPTPLFTIIWTYKPTGHSGATEALCSPTSPLEGAKMHGVSSVPRFFCSGTVLYQWTKDRCDYSML